MLKLKCSKNLLAAAVLFVGISGQAETKYLIENIPFYKIQAPAKGNRDLAEPYRGKVDLAKVEHDLPISKAALNKLDLQSLNQMSQEELDQLYARLSSGPVPDGPFVGKIMDGAGDGLMALSQNIKELSLLKNFGKIGGLLWRGKHFYRSEMILKNNIDGIQRFPAKLYCGQSLLDSRRESIIIDYAYSDDIAGYANMTDPMRLDPLATRQGLSIRDEIRMVRPGLYLGRAYVNRIFLLTFALESKEYAKVHHSADDDCWSGHQARGVTP